MFKNAFTLRYVTTVFSAAIKFISLIDFLLYISADMSLKLSKVHDCPVLRPFRVEFVSKSLLTPD